MKKYTIDTKYADGGDAHYEVEADNLTISERILHLHKDGEVVYSDLVSEIQSLDGIEIKRDHQEDIGVNEADIVSPIEKGTGDNAGFVGSGAEVGIDYEGPTASVYVLTSPTYVSNYEDAPFDEVIVGVFVSKETAEDYRDNATPPVTDGKIVKWGVEGSDVAAVGRIAPFHGSTD